jgi:hypothetical protein
MTVFAQQVTYRDPGTSHLNDSLTQQVTYRDPGTSHLNDSLTDPGTSHVVPGQELHYANSHLMTIQEIPCTHGQIHRCLALTIPLLLVIAGHDLVIHHLKQTPVILNNSFISL